MITKTFRVALFILVGLLTANASAQLIISEYVDANTSRGAIELWNISETNVTFGANGGQLNVRVEIYANGSASATATIVLTPGFVLAAGDVFVLGHSLAPFAPICDQVAGAVAWTGNDAIVVRLSSGTVLDSLGQVGVDPITEWGTGDTSTADNTLRRIIGNTVADTNSANPYDPALYFTGHPLNNTEDLGLPPLANSLASVGTYAPATVSSNEATLYGWVDSHNTSATMWFDYGTSTNYSASTPLQVAGSGSHGYQYVLTGLVNGVTYQYRAAASNSLGVVFGTNVSFTTPILAFSLVTNLTALHSGISGWGDYDNDGRLDLVLCGIWQTYTDTISTFYRYKREFWRNEGIGFSRFEPDNPVPAASITWGDVDNDGWLDALVHSVHIVFEPDGYVMRHGLSVMPTPADPQTTFFGISEGNPLYMVPSWGDFNNDGKLDAAAGVIYRNTGQALVTNGLSGANFGPSAWADFDNDGRLDLALQYHSNVVWRNTATGFTEINAGLPNLQEVSFVPGDYDNDGRVDLLMTGRDGPEPVAQVWRNTGSGFTNINAGLTGFFRGAAAWGDYDNDGRLDLLLTGQTNSFGLPAGTELWRNTQTGFSKVDLAPRLPPLVNSHVAWADFDNDGRLDIFIQGSTNR